MRVSLSDYKHVVISDIFIKKVTDWILLDAINNDAENNHLNERPFNGVGATVNLDGDEEADILAIHNHQDSNLD